MSLPEHVFLLVDQIHYESSTPIGVYWTRDEAIEMARKFIENENKTHHRGFEYQFTQTEDGAEFESRGHSFVISKILVGATVDNWYK